MELEAGHLVCTCSDTTVTKVYCVLKHVGNVTFMICNPYVLGHLMFRMATFCVLREATFKDYYVK